MILCFIYYAYLNTSVKIVFVSCRSQCLHCKNLLKKANLKKISATTCFFECVVSVTFSMCKMFWENVM